MRIGAFFSVLFFQWRKSFKKIEMKLKDFISIKQPLKEWHLQIKSPQLIRRWKRRSQRRKPLKNAQSAVKHIIRVRVHGWTVSAPAATIRPARNACAPIY